ncbi:MAG TPA: PIN domain-containing protein [Acetobacteraceae bacterium]
MRFTLDSNVLIYAVDVRDQHRRSSAFTIVDRAASLDCLLLPQALAEFFHAVSRKRIVPRDSAAAQVRDWIVIFGIAQGPTAPALESALEASLAKRFQFYDALLLATAKTAGCEAVISEDMAAGSELDGVRIIPAFDATGGISPAASVLLG